MEQAATLCVRARECVLFSVWRLGQWTSGVLKDRGIIGQGKERKAWVWMYWGGETGVKQNERTELIINPNKHYTGTDTTEIFRDTQTHTGCCCRPLSG